VSRNRKKRIANLPNDVYKAYDDAGALLYVGISINVFKRLGEHKAYSPWYDEASRIEVVQYLNRASARAEEARCIKFDAPAFNVTQEAAAGCAMSDEIRESFTMFRDVDGWYIDG